VQTFIFALVSVNARRPVVASLLGRAGILDFLLAPVEPFEKRFADARQGGY
jgi:hypothetical protein